MDNNQTEILKKAVKGFCRTKEWPRQFAVALTMKPTLSDPFRQLTEEIASNNLRDFLNLVNNQIYSKSFQCLGKALEVISVLEFSPGAGRFRYHAMIECPDGTDEERFRNIMRNNWYRTEWSRPEVDLTFAEMSVPNEFLKYVSEKIDAGDSMDWLKPFVNI
jgi:hypothetical protein